jgi:L,D-peptidoglycan transpeptidase YkuD (ErfK/YbiS/YcfS/YnhG family)
MRVISGLRLPGVSGRDGSSIAPLKDRSSAARAAALVYPGAVLLASLLAAATAVCPASLANDLRVQPRAGQLITVEARTLRTTYASLRIWRRQGACWVAAGGPWTARLGRTGLSANRREGDGTTPAGTFRIHPTMYGNEANPGVKFRYRQVRCGDWWDEDPSSPTYNTFQHVPCGTAPPFGVNSEGMWENKRAYPFLAVIEFNMRPTVPGRGSGIFLHAQTGGPTIGCVSLEKGTLRQVLRWLRPGATPHIAIGTPALLRR